LFTLAGAAMGFAPSRVVSPRSPELQERLREHIARSKVSYPPGLYEQYEQHYNLIKLAALTSRSCLPGLYRLSE